ncbi:MAG: hypothetical protein JXA18_10545 [Chitinispirillaceae bacterium]|nr:hypothetical protein [Chitinispirillaceae bacterium]
MMQHGARREHPSTTFERGGVRLRAVIVLVTLCIVGGTIYGLLRQFGQNQQINHRKALKISEYGLMVALQKIHDGPLATDGIPRTGFEEGWYRISFNRYVRNDTVFLAVVSEGHAGSVMEKRECILRQNILGPDTLWVRESMR